MKLCIKWICVAFFSVSLKVFDHVCWTGTRPIFEKPRLSQTKWLASGNESGCFSPRLSRTYKGIYCTYIFLLIYSTLTCKPIGNCVTSFRYSLNTFPAQKVHTCCHRSHVTSFFVSSEFLYSMLTGVTSSYQPHHIR